MSDELAPNEERMVNAMVRSGVVIEEGKRYSADEVRAIALADFESQPADDARMQIEPIAALLGISPLSVIDVLKRARRKGTRALAGMGAA